MWIMRMKKKLIFMAVLGLLGVFFLKFPVLSKHVIHNKDEKNFDEVTLAKHLQDALIFPGGSIIRVELESCQLQINIAFPKSCKLPNKFAQKKFELPLNEAEGVSAYPYSEGRDTVFFVFPEDYINEYKSGLKNEGSGNSKSGGLSVSLTSCSGQTHTQPTAGDSVIFSLDSNKTDKIRKKFNHLIRKCND